MSNSNSSETTQFGYRTVPAAEKAGLVGKVFDSVASKYDVMNDIMSLGTHRLIKRFTLELSAVRPGHTVLDLAGGTGDMSLRFAKLVGPQGKVLLSDINASMLLTGRDRILDKGGMSNIYFSQADAESLPFADNQFDCVCIAYGLRNVTNKDTALRAMWRVLKPGGRLLVLEFSTPVNPIVGKAYDQYCRLWPVAGELITGDRDSYQYLVESIRVHPDQETLKGMLQSAGFNEVCYHNVMAGVCAIHVGIK